MNRNYPDINFVEINAEELITEMVCDYENEAERTLYPADPMRLIIQWFASIIIQERILINETAKRNVPRYADGEYLDSLAELFRDVERFAAQKAHTTFKYVLSAAQSTDQLIPKGARIDANDEIVFATTEDLIVPQGKLWGVVAGECLIAGEQGNGFLPGQIFKMVDLYPFVESVLNTTTSEGGTEIENDEALYKRMGESLETFSTAGAQGAYIYHAKTASASIADVSVETLKAGEVNIYVMLENGILPESEILRMVEAAVSPAKVRPMTDVVIAKAPETKLFSVDIKYFIGRPNMSSSAVIKRDIEKAVSDYVTWQTEKMGRDINPSYLTSLLMAAGVKRIEVTAPSFTAISQNMVAKIQTRNIVYGGIEDE